MGDEETRDGSWHFPSVLVLVTATPWVKSIRPPKCLPRGGATLCRGGGAFQGPIPHLYKAKIFGPYSVPVAVNLNRARNHLTPSQCKLARRNVNLDGKALSSLPYRSCTALRLRQENSRNRSHFSGMVLTRYFAHINPTGGGGVAAISRWSTKFSSFHSSRLAARLKSAGSCSMSARNRLKASSTSLCMPTVFT